MVDLNEFAERARQQRDTGQGLCTCPKCQFYCDCRKPSMNWRPVLFWSTVLLFLFWLPTILGLRWWVFG